MKLAIHQMAALSYYSRVQVVLAGLPLSPSKEHLLRAVSTFTRGLAKKRWHSCNFQQALARHVKAEISKHMLLKL